MHWQMLSTADYSETSPIVIYQTLYQLIFNR